MDKIIGIYKITNTLGQIYIGSSVDVENRWAQHRSGNSSGKLRKSILKYGYSNHIFSIVEECEKSNILNRERFWQEHFCSYRLFHLNNYRSDCNSPQYKDKKQSVASKTFYLDTYTGVYYGTCEELAECNKLSVSTLRMHFFDGRIKNSFFNRFIKV